jgi:hypothetical protein
MHSTGIKRQLEGKVCVNIFLFKNLIRPLALSFEPNLLNSQAGPDLGHVFLVRDLRTVWV